MYEVLQVRPPPQREQKEQGEMRSMIGFGVCAAILMWGCVRQESQAPVKVSLPNGADGAVVMCRQKAECFVLSTHACGGSYLIVQKDDKPANDFTSLREGAEYIIQCMPHTDKPAEEASR